MNTTPPSNPVEKEKLRKLIVQGSDSLTRISAEREALKELKKEIKEQFELPVKQINRMIKTYYKNSFDTEMAEAEEFDLLYSAVLQTPTE